MEHDSDYSCIAIGSIRAPVFVQIWEATAENGHGQQLFNGQLVPDQQLPPFNTSTGNIVYQYRTTEDAPWSPDVFSSCIDGNYVGIPE